MSGEILSVTDQRTGRRYEIPIDRGTIRALDLRQIRTSEDDVGLMAYDPGFSNTASCRSTITYIDGEKGILRYRGYPIEQLAEAHNYLEVAHLILFGELPDENEYREWSSRIMQHMCVCQDIKKIISGFPTDAHPMGIVASGVAAFSAFYPEARNVQDEETRNLQIYRLIAKVPVIAAYAYRRTKTLPFVDPNQDLSYTANILRMMFKGSEVEYWVHPVLGRALDVLFVLHADHEQNCSTNSMRSVGSSGSDPYLATAAAIGALAGPSHGGATEAVVHMLREIGTKDKVPDYIQKITRGKFRLMGFGHRIYRNYDPRAKIIKRMAEEVFEVTAFNPLLEVALELERIALQDDYFVSRKLYPNVDFYSGLIYQAMGFPPAMFPVLFAVARTLGWLAQWQEMVLDPKQRIVRPRQIYEGHRLRQVPSFTRASAPE